jgi:hypothetical protein
MNDFSRSFIEILPAVPEPIVEIAEQSGDFLRRSASDLRASIPIATPQFTSRFLQSPADLRASITSIPEQCATLTKSWMNEQPLRLKAIFLSTILVILAAAIEDPKSFYCTPHAMVMMIWKLSATTLINFSAVRFRDWADRAGYFDHGRPNVTVEYEKEPDWTRNPPLDSSLLLRPAELMSTPKRTSSPNLSPPPSGSMSAPSSTSKPNSLFQSMVALTPFWEHSSGIIGPSLFKSFIPFTKSYNERKQIIKEAPRLELVREQEYELEQEKVQKVVAYEDLPWQERAKLLDQQLAPMRRSS